MNLFSSTCAEGEITQEDGHVRVIAGDYRGAKGVAMTYSPVNMWDVAIKSLDRPFEYVNM